MPPLVPLSTRGSGNRAAATAGTGGSEAAAAASLGTLSLHFDGAPCAVGCPFCYLGQREQSPGTLDPAQLRAFLTQLRYDELAIALSEPVAPQQPLFDCAKEVAAERGIPVAVTTTLPLARRHSALFSGVARVSLSVDPAKGAVQPEAIAALATSLERQHPGLEVVLIASLATPEFAARLIEDGLLETLVGLESVDRVVLNALKPPPDWCDRAFWLRSLARLAPLLAQTLDRRLFLDCYVAARLLKLGPCPARADLSPAAGGIAFRSCVYQRQAEEVTQDPTTLAQRLTRFTPPAACPFPIV